MPKLGEIRKATDVGYKHKTNKVIWHACVGCSKQRWVELFHGKPKNLRCRSCSRKGKHYSPTTEFKRDKFGEDSPSWRGGITISRGYVFIYQPDHLRATCGGGIYVKRCYLIYESVYGTLPIEFELHHTNGNKTDDRITNLSAMTKSYHQRVECVLKDLDFVIEPGIRPALKDTWQYIESLKSWLQR